MEHADITIIGAGVIGLAIARELAAHKRETVVLEQHPAFGQETSSRNSEVIHAGLYYPPESLKARLCVRGRELLYAYCSRYGIAHRRIGKLVVATSDEERGAVDRIYRNALACGVKGLRFLTTDEISRYEPSISVRGALYSPETGIFDTHAFMKSLFRAGKEGGVTYSFGTQVRALAPVPDGYAVTVAEAGGSSFTYRTRIVINAAGLGSAQIARSLGIPCNSYLCKGQYFRIRASRAFGFSHLIYPPATTVSLGIHITPDLGGGVRLGPDAAYVDVPTYDVDESASAVFFSSVRAFVPALKQEDLVPDTAGIRPKIQGPQDGFRDFVIAHQESAGYPGFIDLRGIESPGLTASLAIAETVAGMLDGF